MSNETRYWLSRIGSVCAIAGALLAAVGNLLHPVTPRDDPVGVARVIAESDATRGARTEPSPSWQLAQWVR